MTSPDDPEIVSVAHVGNSVQVTFKNDREVATFPARMLHSARDLANRMPDVKNPKVRKLSLVKDKF